MTLQNKKIAFFGTPAFTVDFLELFKNMGLEITYVISGENKPVGRGQVMHAPAPVLWARDVNAQILQPKKLDEDFYTEIAKENFDLFIVIAYGKIISERIINLPKFGTINLHYSLLPKYRGASPVESAILNNENETGITIQQMVYKLDAGNILFQEKMSIAQDDTTTSLRSKLNQRALEVFPGFLEDLFKNPPTPLKGGVEQDENLATTCGKFKKEDLDVSKEIENMDIENIYKKYKAFDKKIYFFHPYRNQNMRVKITDMQQNKIKKVLPESRKEITVPEFINAYGEIFQ